MVLRRVSRLDLLLTVAIGLATGLLAVQMSHSLTFTATHLDVWYDTNSPLVLDQIVNKWSTQHLLNNRHPLFALFTYVPVAMASKYGGVDRVRAAMGAMAVVAALCGSAMYVAMRLMRRPVFIAVGFTAIFLSSTCGLIYLGVAERHLLGALSLLLCVIALALYERRLVHVGWLVSAAAGTLAITITNGLLGALALVASLRTQRGVLACGAALLLVTTLSAVSVEFFPGSQAIWTARGWPTDVSVLSRRGSYRTLSGSVWDKLSAFALHAIVWPTPQVVIKPAAHHDQPILSLQKVGVLHRRLNEMTAIALWLAVLGMGLYRSLDAGTRDVTSVVLVLFAVGQMGFFQIFGTETVLYSPYYAPVMVLIASKSWTAGRAGRVAAALAIALLATLMWTNIESYRTSLEMVSTQLVPGNQ